MADQHKQRYEIDSDRVTRHLASRIADLEVQVAQLDALCQQLAADNATKDAQLTELRARLDPPDAAQPAE